MTNSMGHALLLLAICFMGVALLLTLMTWAESTLDNDDPRLRPLVRRLWQHAHPQPVRVEATRDTARRG